MGIIVLGALVVVLSVFAAALFIRHRAMLRRFARIVDVDREVAAQRSEVERMQHQLRAAAEQDAARREREQTAHAASLAEQQRAATAQLGGELDRLQASLQRGKLEQLLLAEETARRREAADRDHAAAMSKLMARQQEAERAAAARMRALTAEYDERHALFSRLKRELALLQNESEDISFGSVR